MGSSRDGDGGSQLLGQEDLLLDAARITCEFSEANHGALLSMSGKCRQSEATQKRAAQHKHLGSGCLRHTRRARSCRQRGQGTG